MVMSGCVDGHVLRFLSSNRRTSRWACHCMVWHKHMGIHNDMAAADMDSIHRSPYYSAVCAVGGAKVEDRPMKLALESLTEHLDTIQPFSDFAWVRIGRVLLDKKYAEYFASFTRFKVMDCRNEDSPAKVLDMSEVICPNLYAVPYQHPLHKALVESEHIGPERIISIIQGATLEDIFADVLAAPGLLAIPHDIYYTKGQDSPLIAEYQRALIVSNISADRSIYLLGLTTTHELPWYSSRHNIVALVTAMPAVLGLHNQDIADCNLSQETALEKSNLPKLSQSNWAAICRNIALLRRYTS